MSSYGRIEYTSWVRSHMLSVPSARNLMLPALTNDSNAVGGQLSWQAAFWTILAVALNTMTQPTGMILDFPSSFNFFLRLSPLACLSNILHTFLHVSYHVKRTGSFMDAARAWESQRFADQIEATPGVFESLRRNTIFRIGLFLIGALLQVLKLYSCTGISWTQILCSIYLASFLLDEALLALTTLARRTYAVSGLVLPAPAAARSIAVDTTPSVDSRHFAWVAIATDCGLMTTVLYRVTAPDPLLRVDLHIAWALLVTVPFTAVVGLRIALSNRQDKPFELVFAASIAPLLSDGPALVLYLLDFWKQVDRSESLTRPKYLVSTSVTVLVVIGVITVPVLLTILAFGMALILLQLTFRWSDIVFVRLYAAFLLLIGVMMYANYYDATGTYKPAWLRVFG